MQIRRQVADNPRPIQSPWTVSPSEKAAIPSAICYYSLQDTSQNFLRRRTLVDNIADNADISRTQPITIDYRATWSWAWISGHTGGESPEFGV